VFGKNRLTIASDSAIRSHVVMGVAGAGKSAVGSALADALGAAFVEGDAYHPASNVQRMAAGIPLTDADRLPWLQALAARLRDADETGAGLVMACSALKRSYRDVLRAGGTNVTFIYLHGDRELLAARLAQRQEHFMPASLLESQLAALEPPAPDEGAWAYNVRFAPNEIVAAVLERIAAKKTKAPLR
jgi:gluconokinase